MSAVREVLGECDALGFARFFAPAVRELLRLDADLNVVASCGGRSVKLAEVTKAFKRLLAERGRLDASQVFFEAARTVQPVQVTLTGYPRLGLGELTFLDALAGDGSQLALPFAEDALFTENEGRGGFFRGAGLVYRARTGGADLDDARSYSRSRLRQPRSRGARRAGAGQRASERRGAPKRHRARRA